MFTLNGSVYINYISIKLLKLAIIFSTKLEGRMNAFSRDETFKMQIELIEKRAVTSTVEFTKLD